MSPPPALPRALRPPPSARPAAWPHRQTTRTAAQQLLHGAFAPAALQRATLERLAAALEMHTLPQGLVREAPLGFAPSWWLVAEGRIVVGRPGEDGGLVENRIVERGQWFDIAGAWLDSAWIESATCPAPVTLLALPLDTLVACAQLDAALLHAMGHALAERVRELTEGRHELATKDVLSRLALWLLRQPSQPGPDHAPAIRLPVQKRSIARQLVMAQATLSRCFRRLVELGCIEVAGYTVIVRDPAALRGLAGEPPPLAEAPARAVVSG
ncbi:MAG: Crp/Fnr family transcriptional regulator [Xenophilus sp.]